VVDTISRAHRVNENEAGDASRVIGVFETWATRYQVSVLLIHHTRKPSREEEERALGTHDVRGSIVWVAHCQVVGVLSKDEKRLSIHHLAFKNNFERCPPLTLRRRDDCLLEKTTWNKGLTDEQIRSFIGGLPVPVPTEAKMAKLLADEFKIKSDSMRTRLGRMKADGRLDGLWRKEGKGVLYGRATAG
jgi:hypothetical protein